MLLNRAIFRGLWLPISVIALGLLTRWELLFSTIPEGILFSAAGFSIVHSKASIFSLAHIVEHLKVTHLWVEYGLLFGAYLLASWRGGQLNYLHPSLVITLYLLAGAILSVVFDLLFFSGLQDSLKVGVAGQFNVNLTLSGLVLVGGASYLAWVVLNRSGLVKSQYRLSPCRIPKVQISSLPRGVDNVHIDVLLSSRFCKDSNLCIHNLLPIVVRDFQAGMRKVRIPKSQLKPLHDIFAQMVEQTLRRAKDSNEKEIVELLVLAVFKYIHEEVERSVDSYVRHRADTLENRYQQGVAGERDQKFIEYISCYKENVSATINEIILNSLTEHRQLPFHKALKNFLGIKDNFSIQLIKTPLALCGHYHSNFVLLNKYLLTGLLRRDENHFYEMERELSRIFEPYLTLIERNPDEGERDTYEGPVNEKMEVLLQPSIFMDASNISKLLDIDWTKQKIEQATKEDDRVEKRKLKRHLQFQLGQFNRVSKELIRSPISRWLVASYQVKDILTQSNSDISPSALMRIIVNSTSKLELDKRASKNSASIIRFPEMDLVNDAWDVVHNGCAEFIHNNLPRILKDFSRYRRDLLIQCQLLQGYNQIKLLTDKRDIQTSRANYTLHDFSVLSELDEQQGQVRSHIIIKADLRGSTKVTEKLVDLSLNPASHFERNFFTPVNDLIDLYGAEKVFIEGDAIILILNEYENRNSNNHIASRACGLAAHILKVVAQQNKELKCYGLPKLELGIGISFSHSSPRYLFDGDHRITISPAINRADRLSACAWSIRKWRKKQSASMNQVEVYQPSESADAVGAKAQKDMVFNLNGILIEEEVFEKLQKEVELKPVMNKISSMQDSKLFSLIFPDLSGSVHHMIVRKGAVKLYDQKLHVDKCPVVDNRFFYEVVYQKSILDQLRK